MPNKKYPLHGRFIDDQSIDEKTKLIRYPNVKVLPELWELVNFASLNVLQDEQTIFIFNRIGVKIITSNVALTSLNTFPNYVDYVPQNKERVLLIAQTDPLQNGFYEWQTGGNLVRLYDWRDVIAGNGLTINDNNIAIKLLEYLLVPARNDNFLQFDINGKLFARIAADAVGLKLNANKELYIDSAELGGVGGGVSILDVPHPDIHGAAGDDVLTPSSIAVFQIVGGNFRRDASVICEGFTVMEFYDRKSNLITMNVEATNLIGIHNVLVKHLTLDSGDSGKHKFTVLGSAIIDTVSPRAKRGFTTILTVTGEGFALLSAFVTNILGISIALLTVTDRFLVTIEVTVDNSVDSGLYNLICNNIFAGMLYDSGSSGNNKLEIFGDPVITTVFRSPEGGLRVAEVLLGETMEITCNGFDLTDDFLITPNSIATNGITLNSVSGLSTKKFINVTGGNNIADIGVYNLTCNDTINGGNSGTTGDEKVALNYAYSAATIRLPQVFRAFGGATLSDWVITQNVDSVTVERVGGSGMAYLEATDLFLVASLLTFTLGNFGTNLNFTVETLENDMPLNDGINGVYAFIAPIGATITNPQILSQVDSYMRIYNDFGQYKAQYPTGSQPIIIPNMGIRCDGNTNVANETRFNFFNFNSLLPNGTYTKIDNSHQNKAAYIAMSGNFKLNFHLKGWIGE